MTQPLVEESQVVYCMTGDQCELAARRFPKVASKMQRLDPLRDIDDPKGGGQSRFNEVSRHIRDVLRWRLECQLAFPRCGATT